MNHWELADRTAPEDRPTVPAPPGQPCQALFCTDIAVHGSTRCERHSYSIDCTPTSARLEDTAEHR
jgi:hypothetical protein